MKIPGQPLPPLLSLSFLVAFFWLPTAGAQQQPADPAPVAPYNDQCATLTKDLDIDLKKVVAAGCKPSQEQISRMMDNPVGNLAFLLLQEDFTRVKGPHTNGFRNVSSFKVTPTFPITLGQDWSLINRLVLPFNSVPVKKSAGSLFGMSGQEIIQSPDAMDVLSDPFGRTTGFGDLTYVGLFAPSKSHKTSDGGMLVWGVGPTLMFPTAEHSVLGQGKYSAGPAAVLAYLGPDWTLGLFPQHWWSYAGDGDRPDVSMTNIQYFIFKNFGWNWRVGMSPNVAVNWKADGGNKVTLPVGLGASYMMHIGDLPVRLGAEAQYSVVHPDDVVGSRWNFRFIIVPVVPTYLF